MNGPHFHRERPRCRRPTWPPLPRVRRVRADAAHAPAAPHPMMLAALVRARLGVPLSRLIVMWAEGIEPSHGAVLDRVA